MSFTLHDRVTDQTYLDTPAYHPAGTADTPMVNTLGLVDYENETVLYGTAHPLVTADGAVVPARADVRYPTVVPAGMP